MGSAVAEVDTEVESEVSPSDKSAVSILNNNSMGDPGGDGEKDDDATSAAEEATASLSGNPALAEDPQEEEQEECGFCLFMKGGPCGQRFTLWQDCVEGAEKAEKDIVQQCAQLTTLLKVCMEMNPEYYGPVLEAEKAMEAAEIIAQQENVVGEPRSGEGANGEEAAKSEGGSVTDDVKSSEVSGSEEVLQSSVGQVADEVKSSGEEAVDSAVGQVAGEVRSGGEEAADITVGQVAGEVRSGGEDAVDSAVGQVAGVVRSGGEEAVDSVGKVPDEVRSVEAQNVVVDNEEEEVLDEIREASG